MEKFELSDRFNRLVDEECLEAEVRLGHGLNRRIIVRAFGADLDGLDLSPTEFIDKIHLGDNLFYRIIDVMITEVRDDATVVLAKISDHTPVEFSRKWHGLAAPFKRLKAKTIIESWSGSSPSS